MKKQLRLQLYMALLGLVSLSSYGQLQIGVDIDGKIVGDWSGASVSLSSDGTVVAIGANHNNGNGFNSGHVRVYKNISGIWTQVGADIDGEAAGDLSGVSVSLSSDGTVVAIGANGNDGNGIISGHVRVYKNVSGAWDRIGADIDGEAAGDQLGRSVSLSSDGTVVAIGALLYDGNGNQSNQTGHVRVYKNVSGAWVKIGNDIDGEVAEDQSGTSVSLSPDGTVVAIGAPLNDGNGNQTGHVRVYKNVSGTWVKIGNDIDGEAAEDQSGTSVSLSDNGTVVAIGAPYNNGKGVGSGHVRVYKNVFGTWVKIGHDIDGEAANDRSGASINLSPDGTVVAIGAPYNNGKGVRSGHVRVYKNVSGTWVKIGNDIDGEAARDYSGGDGISLSSDGTVVAIGARVNDGNGDQSGHVRVYDLNIGTLIQAPVGIADVTPFEATIAFSRNVTGFTEGDIVLTNAEITNFNPVSPSEYTVTITPTSCHGNITIDVPVNVVEDATGFRNLAASTAVTVSVLPSEATVSANTPVCSGEDAVFTITGTADSDVTYTIDGEAPITEKLVGGTVTVQVNGVSSDTTLNLTEVANGNCSVPLTATAVVTVEDIQLTAVTQNITVQLDANGQAFITPQQVDNGSSNPCGGIDSMALDITSFDCPELGDVTVTLTVTDTAGNPATGTATVTIEAMDTDNNHIADTCESLVIIAPGGFSPNGDGIGDTWVVENMEDFPNNRVQIFNQWGEPVFETNNYQNDWNGVSNRTGGSKRLPVGAYLYIINFNKAGINPKTGWIYINY